MQKYVLIVAGGSGSRMKSNLPKQFLPLCGEPILMRTISAFHKALPSASIVVVLPESQISYWEELCQKEDFTIAHRIAKGGSTRYESVQNGLALCADSGLVGIHDGVRPLVSTSMIEQCFDDALTHGSSIPCVPVTQSLRKVSDDKSHPVDRTGIMAVQTPQCFKVDLLKPCYDQPASASFTDDATVFESLGHQVFVSPGEETNIKITTQADLRIAEAILNR